MPSDHRLHPSSILFALGGSLKAFALPAVFLLVTSGRSSSERSGRGGWDPAWWMNRWVPGDFEIANWQFWLLLFLIPSLIVALARYLSFRLRYEGSELVIRSGIIFRNERHVPYERIQNLDAVRNIVHRLLGVAEVRVETGGGQAPEATISVLHETAFEEMRRRIFEGRRRATAMAEDQPETTPTDVPVIDSRTLLHLPLRELLLNGLLDNRGLLLIAAAYGVLWEAGLSRLVWERTAGGWYQPGLLRDTVRSLAAGNLPSPGRVALLLLGIVVLLVLVRMLSMVWSVLRLHEFRLSRVGEDLRTEYGMLTRITATIPLKRVQTLTIQEAPLQRLVKRMSVRVETAGGHGHQPREEGKQSREPLAPIIRQSAVPALLRDVLPIVDLSALEWQPLHPRAFRRAIKPAMLVAVVTAIPLVYGFGWRGLAVLLITLPWFGVASWAHVRHMQWAVTDDVIALRSGWLWRQVTVAPIAKIQAVSSLESPFDRRAAMAGLRVDTAGGRLHQISIPYLARETTRTLYEKLAAQTAQTSFRWCFVALALLGASCSRPATAPAPAASATSSALWGEMKPVVSIKELMTDLIDPAADDVFNAVSTTIGPKGIVEVEPRTDDDWARVRSGAVTLAESVSLLKIPRPIAPPDDRPAAPDPGNAELPPDQIRAKILADPVLWNAKIEALRNINLTILDVVRRRNVSELVEAGAILDQACETCHLEFWYPAERGLMESLDRQLRGK